MELPYIYVYAICVFDEMVLPFHMTEEKTEEHMS